METKSDAKKNYWKQLKVVWYKDEEEVKIPRNLKLSDMLINYDYKNIFFFYHFWLKGCKNEIIKCDAMWISKVYQVV